MSSMDQLSLERKKIVEQLKLFEEAKKKIEKTLEELDKSKQNKAEKEIENNEKKEKQANSELARVEREMKTANESLKESEKILEELKKKEKKNGLLNEEEEKKKKELDDALEKLRVYNKENELMREKRRALEQTFQAREKEFFESEKLKDAAVNELGVKTHEVKLIEEKGDFYKKESQKLETLASNEEADNKEKEAMNTELEIQNLKEEIDLENIEIRELLVDMEKEMETKVAEEKKVEELEIQLKTLDAKRSATNVNKCIGHVLGLGMSILGFFTANPALAVAGVSSTLSGFGSHVTEVTELDRQIEEIEKKLSTARRNLNNSIKKYDEKKCEKEKVTKTKEEKINQKNEKEGILRVIMSNNEKIREKIKYLKENVEKISQEKEFRNSLLQTKKDELSKLKDRIANAEKSLNVTKDNLADIRPQMKENDEKSKLLVEALMDAKKKSQDAKKESNSNKNDKNDSVQNKTNNDKDKVKNLEKKADALNSNKKQAVDDKIKAENNNKGKLPANSALNARKKEIDTEISKSKKKLSDVDNKLKNVNQNVIKNTNANTLKK